MRIEELINYFRYDYPQPDGDVPFSVHTEVADCPWNTDHRLVRIGLKGREIAARQAARRATWCSCSTCPGSMQPANKLPLVKRGDEVARRPAGRERPRGDRRLRRRLGPGARLRPTGDHKRRRSSRRSTSCKPAARPTAAGGIQLAYDVAVENFIKGGTNRVILATDGDFNVGITDRGELVRADRGARPRAACS